MAHTTDTATPSLDRFFETVHGFHRTAVIKTAIELDVFSLIAEGCKTADALAERCRAAPRGMRILCDQLTVIGFLSKIDGDYTLASDAELFLTKRSPAYVGTAIDFLLSDAQMEPFRALTSAVRQGGTAMETSVGAPDHPVWVAFARAMAPLMMFPSELLAQLIASDPAPIRKVVDVAAGHGLYGIAIAKRNPDAQIVAVDWPNVLDVAVENARAAGLADRYTTLPGSAFDVEYGRDCDLILLTNFLHHFDPSGCEAVLRKCAAALQPGGRVAILEFIPNEDRVTPPIAASFSLMMLATTPRGDAYTFAQYAEMLRRVGFSANALHDLPPTYFRAVIARK